jgi:hypothetical protein
MARTFSCACVWVCAGASALVQTGLESDARLETESARWQSDLTLWVNSIGRRC